MSEEPTPYQANNNLALPIHWRHAHPIIRDAVMTHTHYTANPKRNRPPTPHEIGLVKIYLAYWYNYPGFMKNPRQVQNTNKLIYNATSNDELSRAVLAMLEEGIDPL